MTFAETVEAYIAWRRSLGTEFRTESQVLRFFLKHVDGERGCDDITRGQVCAFLAGNGRLTQTRSHRYCILTGFFRYAIARGHATRSPLPLPEDEPKKPSPLPPYIYTHDELRRLFAALGVRRRHSRQLDTTTVRTLLLLLYGAGLRGAEARGLTLAHVDLRDAVLTVRDTKFHKSRLVPVGPQLTAALRQYRNLRATRPHPDGEDSPFLANRDGTRLASTTVNHAFRRLLRLAGIHDTDRTRQSPNMHALRHSFAVHRLTSWYRQGADVQRLLPYLSVYLGHARLAYTQVYLSMTPELLQQASLRFERYVEGHGDA